MHPCRVIIQVQKTLWPLSLSHHGSSAYNTSEVIKHAITAHSSHYSSTSQSHFSSTILICFSFYSLFANHFSFITGCAVIPMLCWWRLGLSIGKGKLWPPIESIPLTDCQNIRHRWLCWWPYAYAKFGASLSMEAPAQMGKIQLNAIILVLILVTKIALVLAEEFHEYDTNMLHTQQKL